MTRRALFYADPEDLHDDRIPGSFALLPRGEAGLYEMAFYCPCGCGVGDRILVGDGQKPGGARPSWRWNGSRTEPTLDPSVNRTCGWHGWLRDGYWEAC